MTGHTVCVCFDRDLSRKEGDREGGSFQPGPFNQAAIEQTCTFLRRVPCVRLS